MTSNISQIIQEKFENLKGSMEEAQRPLKRSSQLNYKLFVQNSSTIDEIVMFTPLSSANITKIVGLQLKSY
jgi:ATP-dependent Clp protease ATP-binding subunit ClpB